MPPRKRKASDVAVAQQPNKRITRSSTRHVTPSAQPTTSLQETEAKSSKTKETTSEAKSRSKIDKDASKSAPYSNVTNKKAAAKAKVPAQAAESSLRANHESLSITSDLVKNDIQCHSYACPSNSNAPTLIFTHGAGGTLEAPAVVNFCNGFSAKASIIAFQGSMNLASRVRSFLACIKHFRDGKRLVLGGRSMGARAAVMASIEAAAENAEIVAELVLVSYPLQGPKDVRSQVLLDLPATARVLFIIGDRDSMCPLDLLDDVRGKMKAKSQLVVVRSADHGMHTKPAKLEKGYGKDTGRLAAEWLSGKLSDEVTYIGEEG